MGIDETGVQTWKENTTAFDRVQSVASALSIPRPASYIADEAVVAENTAREHLNRLVELNILLKTDDVGTTKYQVDPLHIRMQTLRDLLDDHDQDELIDLKIELQTKIEFWRDEHNASSPTDLRERAAETDDAAATRETVETASDWELVEYRLSIVEDAIENYATYDRDSQASA